MECQLNQWIKRWDKNDGFLFNADQTNEMVLTTVK